MYIRFNPDAYRTTDGERVNPDLEDRLERLKEEIERQMDRIENGENTGLVERVYLYYDGFDE